MPAAVGSAVSNRAARRVLRTEPTAKFGSSGWRVRGRESAGVPSVVAVHRLEPHDDRQAGAQQRLHLVGHGWKSGSGPPPLGGAACHERRHIAALPARWRAASASVASALPIALQSSWELVESSLEVVG
jgi:hypothetical protein